MLDDLDTVAVVGSGPAGAMAALQLVRRGVPVTMLESGREFPRGLLVRALGQTILQRYPQLAEHGPYATSDDSNATWLGAATPGGLSNHWMGTVPRFAPNDFLEGERLHERFRWPVTYEELAPYYERVEQLLRITGDTRSFSSLPASRITYRRRLPACWLRIARAAEAFGHGLTPAPLAEGARWSIKRTAAAFNSFTSIIVRLLDFPNFRLELGAHVLRIECSQREARAQSVIFHDRFDRCERRLGCRAVVLAAGPLGSTKLLLDSSSAQFPDGLGNTEGLLGKYVHDHPKYWFELELEEPIQRLSYPIYLTRAPYQATEPLSGASCSIVTARRRRHKLLGVIGVPTRRLSGLVLGTTIPRPDSSVSLHPTEKDEFGLPVLDLHISHTRRDLDMAVRARNRLAEILDFAGHGHRFGEALPDLDAPGTACHFGGSVRMHDSPRYGMVNRWNRLHAVDNVAVVDASSFTTGAEKNPTLTVMALAARAADKLARDLREA